MARDMIYAKIALAVTFAAVMFLFDMLVNS